MGSPKPVVSVVIPTYNRADTLAGAIDTVLQQTYDRIETVVVDDGSTDRTPELIDEYGGNARCYRFETNQGANAARNKGIELATGEYVAFLDSDDRWKPAKIAKQVDRLHEAGSKCSLVHTGIERQDLSGATIDTRVPAEPEEPKRRLLFGNFVGTFSCVLVRSDAFEQVGILDESLPSWQDWEFYFRIAEEFEFALVPEPLTIKRAGRGDQISRDMETLVEETYPRFERIISDRAIEYGVLTKRRALATLMREVGDAALLNEEPRLARKFLFGAMMQYPFTPTTYVLLLLALGGNTAYNAALRAKSVIDELR